ncbi:MAG: porin [Methylophilaceae bacterium]|nr:porin [Methylophilaceae bacterium]
MNKKLGLAVASAVLAFGASAANAGIVIPAGDWTVDISGNINAYVTHVEDNVSINGLPSTRSSRSNVQGGTLSSAFGIGAKTRQNDLDIGFQFTMFADGDGSAWGGSTGAGSGPVTANGSSFANVRQAYLTVGDKSWGSVKAGRDIGLFASEALLSDMALLGGVGQGNSSLAHVGSGYMYADWVNQVQYNSPNWNGLTFAFAVRAPLSNGANANNQPNNANWVRPGNKELGYDGKIGYDWSGNVAGNPLTARAYFGALYQKQDASLTSAGYDSWGGEVGGKVGYWGFELTGYYYNGQGLDSQVAANTLIWGGLLHGSSANTKDEGGYAQLTYKIPTIGTKVGISYGVSDSVLNGAWNAANESFIVGAYHPLTKSLNLVAEYSNQQQKASFNPALGGNTRETHDVDQFSIGAILFF